MANYKIVASDLDGTLLDSHGKITAENLAAISELSEKGIHFVPATGRSFVEIPDMIKSIPEIRYFIHSSGAVVYDKLTDERISFCFPKELSAGLLNFLFGVDCHLTIRHLGKMYADKEKMNEESFAYHKMWEPHAALLRSVGEPVESFKERFTSVGDVEMISVFIRDERVLEEVRARLSQFSDVNVASACPHNIELTYAKAGKGNALVALAEKLGFSVEQTIAVGDSENDMPMIQAAGLGLAMSNATDELKSQADETICSNDEHAVDFIAKNFL